MTENIELKKLSSPRNRDHMANERTFLAWMRTSIGIMAFGFVVEKFSLFMKEIAYFLAKEHLDISTAQKGYASIFGILLVALGAVIGFFSFLKYRSVNRKIEEDNYQSSLALGVVLTVAVVAMGVFLVIYLIKT